MSRRETPRLDEGWEEIEQAAPSRTQGACCLALRPPRPGGSPMLWLHVSPDLAERLGWVLGTPLALSIGTVGEAAGWVRFAASREGRPLRTLGRKDGTPRRRMFASFNPGPLGAWEADQAEAEYRQDGRTLYVRIPWALGEAAGQAEAA